MEKTQRGGLFRNCKKLLQIARRRRVAAAAVAAAAAAAVAAEAAEAVEAAVAAVAAAAAASEEGVHLAVFKHFFSRYAPYFVNLFR